MTKIVIRFKGDKDITIFENITSHKIVNGVLAYTSERNHIRQDSYVPLDNLVYWSIVH